MQMILIGRCTFYLPTANIIRAKAKVRVSPKGWCTVFRRFVECKDTHSIRLLQTNQEETSSKTSKVLKHRLLIILKNNIFITCYTNSPHHFIVDLST